MSRDVTTLYASVCVILYVHTYVNVYIMDKWHLQDKVLWTKESGVLCCCKRLCLDLPLGQRNMLNMTFALCRILEAFFDGILRFG